MKNFWVLIISLALLLSSFSNIQARSEINFRINGTPYSAQNELVVKYKQDNQPFRVEKIDDSKTLSETIEFFEERSDVLFAEPNYIATAQNTPNDPLFNLQWHLQSIANGGVDAISGWEQNQGENVVIAVVDTGIAYEYYRDGRKNYYRAPDLADTCFVSGYDFVNSDSHPNDDHSHGTHVAGAIAQTTNNNFGVAGVAYKACLMPIKVLDKYGRGRYSDIAAGIRFAADHGAHIINLSLGGPYDSQILHEAVAYAFDRGVTIIAAAGNDGENNTYFPAGYNDYVIAVGATAMDRTLAYYSNFGGYVDFVAPGGDMTVDQNGDGYGDGILQNTFDPRRRRTDQFNWWFFQGTSLATAQVSAIAALVISSGDANNSVGVRKIFEQTAVDLGTLGRDDFYGFGLLNAKQALDWPNHQPITNLPPLPSGGPPTIRINQIKIASVQSRNIDLSDNYYIRINLNNFTAQNQSATLEIVVYDGENKIVNWPDLGSQLVTIPARNKLTLRLKNSLPVNSTPGLYRASAKLLANDQILDISESIFNVSP